jgi:hypothetical protein
MSKIEAYKESLRSVKDLDEYLLKESGLPGPRGNIELGQAVADVGDEKLFKRLIGFTAEKAPVNSPYEFLAFCGTVGMGRLLAEGHREALEILKDQASDSRWRVREAVAMALQRYGMADMGGLVDAMGIWSSGSMLEQRAAAAALCEPALLKDKQQVIEVLKILDKITSSLAASKDRKSDDFKALKKGLSYCWSVAVSASPDEGKRMMEKWLTSDDKDIKAIMKENLKKNRLTRMDPAWTEKCKNK